MKLLFFQASPPGRFAAATSLGLDTDVLVGRTITAPVTLAEE